MARWTASHRSITPTATADTTDLVDSTYPLAIVGGSTTQRIDISEVYLGGQAGASSPTIMVLGRDSQVATGSLTADTTLNNAANDPATAALAAAQTVFNKAATLKPRRSSTLGCMWNASFNAFGGVVRLVCPPGGEIKMLGNAASFGETSLSAFTGGTTGLLGCHMVYEPF